MHTNSQRARESHPARPYLTTPRDTALTDNEAHRTASRSIIRFFKQRDGSKSRLDGFLSGANLNLWLGLLPVGVYWFACSDFGVSRLPWKISVAIYFLSPAALYTHHLLNRQTKRLIWVGVASSIGLLPLLTIFGSYWLFYFGFAPIPVQLRVVALAFGFTVIIIWSLRIWRAFSRNVTKRALDKRLYEQQDTQILYSAASDEVTTKLEDLPGDLIVVPMRLVSALGPVIVGFSFYSNHASYGHGGPHYTFIVLSIFSIPATCWFLKHFFIRIAYFHIYLPAKLERSTGKPVIFDA